MKRLVSLLVFIICIMQFSFAQKNSKEAILEQEGMYVVYAGIPMEFTAAGGGEGYTSVFVSPSVVTASSSQIGSYITVKCIGKPKKGKNVVLDERNYLVKPTPKPNLYIGDFEDGAILDSIPDLLKVSFGDNSPFSPRKGSFNVMSYIITVSGVKGNLEGTGNTISEEHLKILNEAARGSAFSVQVKYSGTSQGIASAMFKGSSILRLKSEKDHFIADLKALHILLNEKKYEEASEFFVLSGMGSFEEIKNELSKLIDQSEISEKGIELLSTNGSFGGLKSIFPERAEEWINRIGYIGDGFILVKTIKDNEGNSQTVYNKKGSNSNFRQYEKDDIRLYEIDTETETINIDEAEISADYPDPVEYMIRYPLYAMRLGSAEVAGAWNGEHFQFFRLDDVGKLK